MISTPFRVVAVLVFTGHSVSSSRMSATLSPVRMEAPALTAWTPTAVPAPWDTMDRTAR